MFETWFNLLHLASEAQQVVGLRLLRLAAGGVAAQDEAVLMVSEKLEAGLTTLTAVAAGASADHVVRAYRREVQANVRRLTSP